jgi:hypothetical protein
MICIFSLWYYLLSRNSDTKNHCWFLCVTMERYTVATLKYSINILSLVYFPANWLFITSQASLSRWYCSEKFILTKQIKYSIYERLMPDYIMTSNFNLRIQKQAWFHCDVKLSQTCPIRSHKHARFYKETTLSFHLMHIYNSVRVSVLLLYYKTIDISEWKV